MPQGILLPVLAVLLVTQEWGQRTGLVTFAQVPHRSKVLGAKLLAAVLFVLAAFAIAVALAAVLTPIAGADDPWQDVTLPSMARVILRSEERRVGNECVRTGGSWWPPNN